MSSKVKKKILKLKESSTLVINEKSKELISKGKKVYQFTVKWGEETSTDDKEGDITQTSDKRPSKEQIKATLSDFSGEIIQTPPMYSAIKIKGEAAYKIARRGDTVEMPKRTVTIHSLSLKSTTKDTATFEAEVSKGTYIRALGRDMGQKLGCYGHIVELIRTQCGPFSLENCISQEKLDVWAKNRQDAPTFLIPVEAALADIPAYRATFEEQKQVLAGHTLTRVHLDSGLMKVVNRYGKVISLVDVDDKGQMHIVRNFNTA